jgi:hypothetical protein
VESASRHHTGSFPFPLSLGMKHLRSQGRPSQHSLLRDFESLFFAFPTTIFSLKPGFILRKRGEEENIVMEIAQNLPVFLAWCSRDLKTNSSAPPRQASTRSRTCSTRDSCGFNREPYITNSGALFAPCPSKLQRGNILPLRRSNHHTHSRQFWIGRKLTIAPTEDAVAQTATT